MQIATTRFGTIEVKDESVLKIDKGMFGFEHCQHYVLLEDEPEAAFKWMQSVDDPTVAFMIVNPNDFFPDYEVNLNDEEADSLGLTDPSESAMFTTITVARDQSRVTTNLVGPVVINLRTMQARQFVIQDDRYCTKQVIGDQASKSEPIREQAKAAA